MFNLRQAQSQNGAEPRLIYLEDIVVIARKKQMQEVELISDTTCIEKNEANNRQRIWQAQVSLSGIGQIRA